MMLTQTRVLLGQKHTDHPVWSTWNMQILDPAGALTSQKKKHVGLDFKNVIFLFWFKKNLVMVTANVSA